ncbi:hypothetical protein A2960_04910 [Candidatus Gottesmanbacteria bacterium RIFCSPLOWO2_01_FULL_39_12b]|uniref:Bacterial toxin RNase RnlA/LsoA DBD domain-containing protein n=1 Tax=Candidatus Gottesmanbacteria bacterium RIFCSPLOWO2_01_FULL_39_12b TaxID=1798388 RepID=A0A1F6ANM3_9BACT|nr:MAG: hypothetical protein A2960_04910 [Candidatus Gottesmanbacteria bacterium RIFCSPLOWO2_01_FULL_39_12b]
MINIDQNSYFWQYLSDGQKGLVEEGLYLLKDLKEHPDAKITDHSYLVFPFAKAYEGFLKKLFLDLGYISQKEYEGEHFRIGKALNPHLERRLRKWSIYDKISQNYGSKNLAENLWQVWKEGRNLVFHYFPHNFRALTLVEAERIVDEIISIMQEAVSLCKLK